MGLTEIEVMQEQIEEYDKENAALRLRNVQLCGQITRSEKKIKDLEETQDELAQKLSAVALDRLELKQRLL